MRNSLLMAVSVALGLTATASAQSRESRQEARLAQILAGRVAGSPVSCILTGNDGSKLIVLDRLGIVYDAGDIIYLARAIMPEMWHTSDRLEFVRKRPSHLCTDDRVLTVDRNSGLQSGAVQFERFVPYVKAG